MTHMEKLISGAVLAVAAGFTFSAEPVSGVALAVAAFIVAW